MLEVSIIIVSWNTRELLAACLASLYQYMPPCSFDLWVIDNASTDGSVAMVRSRFPDARLVVNAENAGFARANNQAIRQSAGRWVLLFNSDAVATPGALEAMLMLARTQPRAAVIGAHLLNPDGSFQASHTAFPTLGREFLILTGLGRLWFGRMFPSAGPQVERGPQAVGYVEGACLLVRREAIEQVGGMDEGYFMYAEEVDWCRAMQRAGWEVWYHPAARIIHHGGGSSRQRRPQREADLYRSRVRYFRKWHGARAAALLKALLYGLTAVKMIGHGGVRWLTRGRWGRTVVSVSYLARALRGV